MYRIIVLGLLCVHVASSQEEAPDEAPEEERGLVLNSSAAFEGYTLYSPLREKTTYLVDMQGRVVHTWQHDLNPGNNVYLADDGSLYRAASIEDAPRFKGGGQGGRIERIAWDGTVLWSFTLADEQALHHHDYEVLPGGNLLLIAWQGKTREQALAAGRDPEALGKDGLWPDWILELKPEGTEGGEIVWEWHSWDHLIQDFDPAASNYGDVTAHPERIDINADHRRNPPLSEAERARLAKEEADMKALGYVGGDDEEEEDGEPKSPRRSADWLHTNGIDHDPERDLIVISARTMSEVWVIDHSTTTAEARSSQGGRYGRGGDLLWRWGNPRNYGAGKGRDRRLWVQHDPRFVPAGWPGGGHVTVYNNGGGRPGEEFSTVEEIALVLDDEGGFVRGERGVLEPLDATWSHGYDESERFYSSFISGTERLPNGNTLITVGAKARIFEVTAAGEVVWDYLVPFQPAPEPEAGAGDDPGPPPDGARPAGGRGGGRAGGPPPGRRRGPGGMAPSGLHRAGRVAKDHPGLSGKDLRPMSERDE